MEIEKSMGTVDNANCKDCFYYKRLHPDGSKICQYILVEGKMRPCDPGNGCTVKIPLNIYRRSKSTPPKRVDKKK